MYPLGLQPLPICLGHLFAVVCSPASAGLLLNRVLWNDFPGIPQSELGFCKPPPAWGWKTHAVGTGVVKQTPRVASPLGLDSPFCRLREGWEYPEPPVEE